MVNSTDSDIKLKLYFIEVMSNGDLGDVIANEQIFVDLKKGHHIYKINTVPYNLIFPDNGLVVAFEIDSAFLKTYQSKDQNEVSFTHYGASMNSIIEAESVRYRIEFDGQKFRNMLKPKLGHDLVVKLILSN